MRRKPRKLLSRRRRILRRGSPVALVASTALGVIAGFAVGAVIVQRQGGLRRILDRLFTPLEDLRGDDGASPPASVYELDRSAHGGDHFMNSDDELEDGAEDEALAMELEERVLATFLNDPILRTCSVLIRAESDGIVELRGAVEDREKRQHAATLARGVPGVVGVVNSITVRRARSVRTS